MQNKTSLYLNYLLILFGSILLYPSINAQTDIELKNGFFYIDGNKFFVKGVGYEVGAIPGQLPWERTFDADLLNFDMQRIENAGFNTIRTWGAFTNDELNVVKNHDIKIIMGIWVDPHGDFSDPTFINDAKNIVSTVLEYSKNYDNIISYLIMNEPLPETVFAAGYEESLSLWQQLMDIIHANHTGVPVSIANTSNGTYIDADFFDFNAYNVYPYNPSTVNHSHKYPVYIDYLSLLRNDGKPLIITEYGLSVSPTGPGNLGYGGNTLTEQKEGILYMYRSLIDGGASGSCVFNYSDGWWKAGNEFVHDDLVEEWFGLINYTSLSDKYGTPRPVWGSLQTYQTAIVTEPKNSAIYLNKIPIEIFFNDTIRKMEIHHNGLNIYTKDISKNYLTDTIDLAITDVTDVKFDYLFYDVNNMIVKSEAIIFLVSVTEIELPSIEIVPSDTVLNASGSIIMNYKLYGNELFTIDNVVDYVFYPHYGFEYGDAFTKSFSFTNNWYAFGQTHSYNSNIEVVSCAAGFNIYFGEFSRRIYNQIMLFREKTNTSVLELNIEPEKVFLLFPNPVDTYFKLLNTSGSFDDSINYKILTLKGDVIQQGMVYTNEPVNVESLKTGFYFVQFQEALSSKVINLSFIKL